MYDCINTNVVNHLLFIAWYILCVISFINAQSLHKCKFAIQVANAGTADINGIYHEELSGTSDGVPYYYMYSTILEEWIFLYREPDDNTGEKYWVFQSLTQVNQNAYQDIYLVKSSNYWPPSAANSGWEGNTEWPTYSIGDDPKPTISIIPTSGKYSSTLDECVRDCEDPSYIIDKNNCSYLNVTVSNTIFCLPLKIYSNNNTHW